MHSHRAIKSLGGNRIGEYTVLFGSPRLTDASKFRDFFTPQTQFMLDAYEKRPMLYHHALEAAAKVHPALLEDPLIGYWDKTEMDEFGIYQEGELIETHPAYGAVKAQIEDGALFPSSDSAEHLVRRRKHSNGANEIVRWPLLATSLTPVPAEPRMAPVPIIESAFKSLGVDFEMPEDSNESAPDGAAPRAGKTQSEESQTARETVRSYAERMVGYAAMKTSENKTIPAERVAEIEATVTELETACSALKTLLPRLEEAPVPPTLAVEMAPPEEVSALRQRYQARKAQNGS